MLTRAAYVPVPVFNMDFGRSARVTAVEGGPDACPFCGCGVTSVHDRTTVSTCPSPCGRLSFIQGLSFSGRIGWMLTQLRPGPRPKFPFVRDFLFGARVDGKGVVRIFSGPPSHYVKWDTGTDVDDLRSFLPVFVREALVLEAMMT